ncbi:MAG: M15 family metallopeptidase [Gammaproteobacteria bacterium]|nr:M15 family metallopeptidase [Gammaproteobacteria bacterium]MBU1731039.1 M15 family metallopeptidase [Gammaproteobacteria bacterium]MBU1893699.1 M15 family metallopeptidase [Gammaproteobacteria bacterium]
MASRKLSDLSGPCRIMAEQFLDRCHEEGLEVLVTCTYRSLMEQAELYAMGRTKPGKIVTNAMPGQSMHNHSLNGLPAADAFDVVPMRDGKPVWGTSGADGELWQRLGEIGRRCGLKWAGDWKRFKEFPHFQYEANP